ncbi:P-loop NTPase fold protein [Actinomycetes bacterium KLBMP 9797]
MTQAATSRLAGSIHHMYFVTVGGELALATARNQGLELIDATDGAPLRVIAPDRIATTVLAMPGPRDDDILLAGAPDGTLYGYDPATGAELFGHALGTGSVRDLAVYPTPDGPAVAAILDSGLHLWRPEGGPATRLPDPPEREPSRLFKVCAYAVGDRQYVAAAYTDGYLATWDLHRPDAVPTAQRAHDGQIWSMIAAQDGDGTSIVVSGAADRRMRVWGEPAGDAGALRAREAFLADGTIRRVGHVSDKQTTMLVTASATGLVALWRLDGSTDRPELEISRHGSEVWALACVTTSDGVVIASGDMNGDIQIKHLSTALLDEETIRGLFQTDTTIWAVAHGDTVDGPYVACAGVGQVVNVIDPSGRRPPLALRAHASTVRALATAGDRQRPHLISGGADHRVLDWDPAMGELRGELPMGHQGEVWALTTFRDGDEDYLVTGSADGTVRLISLDAEVAEARVLASECGEVNAVIAVPSEGGPLVVVGSGKGLQAFPVRGGKGRHVALSAVSAACGVHDTGRILVVAALHDGRVQLIDPIAAATVETFTRSHESGQIRALEAVEVAGTTFVLGGCDDGRVVVWHIDGTLVGNPVRGGTAGIRSMDVVAIAHTDGTVHPRSRGDGAGPTRSALITAGHDGTVRLWPITIDSPLRSGGSVGRGVRPASILLQDQPTERDHLSRDALVETLYDALASPHTKPPVVVGVHAPWGQGKSSLLRQLRGRVDPWTKRAEQKRAEAERHRATATAEADGADDEETSHHLVAKPRPRPRWRFWTRWRRPTVRTRLTRAWAWRQIHRSGDHSAPLEYEMRPRAAGSGAITVWFNPWMYERTDQIWAGLTREILISVTERLSKPERERLWFDLNLRRTDPTALRRRILASYLPRTLFGVIVATLLLFLVVVAVVSMSVAAVNHPTVVALLGPSTLVVVTVLLTIAQLTKGSFKHVHGWVAPDELNNRAGPEHAWKGSNDPLASTDRGYLYMLQHDVAEVVGLAAQNDPLYVFIDDLDRCGPAIVADTIEAINLFLNKAFGKCVFVIALDPATVAAHLETAFQDIDRRAVDDPASFGHLRHTGWRFMEKIIDLPIRLPRVPDTALSGYLDQLLDPTPVPAPITAAAAPPPPRRRGRRPPRQRVTDAVPAAASSTTTVGLVIVPDTPTTASSVATVGELEALPPVRDALRAAVLSLPGRNPRQTKAFINLWRFYMVLDHRMGLFNPSLLAIERHSIEMARLVELMVRWPYLLDPLGERAEGHIETRNNLDRLLDACVANDDVWAKAARLARLDPADRSVQGLRALLRQARPHRDVFSSIANRYL